MAEGIRIRPKDPAVPTDALVVVVDHARPHPLPRSGRSLEEVQPVCIWCHVQHFAKAYHFWLRDGSVIVSTTVWERLQGLADNPFEYVNPVAEPPDQGLLFPTAGQAPAAPHLIEKFAMPINTRSN